MWFDLILFVPIAILTNTTFPVPFEPVLLGFTAGHTQMQAFIFVVAGTLCAGIGGYVDVRFSRAICKNVARPSAMTVTLFYLVTTVCAFLPVPFSIVRITLLKTKPSVVPYALAIMMGRLPRYWILAHFSIGIFVA